MKKYLVLGLLLSNVAMYVVAMEQGDGSRLVVPAISLTGEPAHIAIDIKPLARKTLNKEQSRELKTIKRRIVIAKREEGGVISQCDREKLELFKELAQSPIERLLENQIKVQEDGLANIHGKLKDIEYWTKWCWGAGGCIFFLALGEMAGRLSEDSVSN